MCALKDMALSPSQAGKLAGALSWTSQHALRRPWCGQILLEPGVEKISHTHMNPSFNLKK